MARMGDLRLRRAVKSDRGDVLQILDEAARWLSSIEIQQWPLPFPRVTVDGDFEQNTVWLAELDGKTVATASILTKDPMFWGDVRGNAWYLHRLAIRRSVAGTGARVLALLESEATQRGVEWIRLDCGVGLQAYYERAGYQLRSSVSLLRAASSPPRSLWFCYEKSLSSSV